MVRKKPKIVCGDHFFMTPEALKVLEDVSTVIWSDAESEEGLIQDLKEAKLVISEYVKITSRILSTSTHLKGIVVWGVGYDHIDIEAASKRGIYVANTSGSNSESVAEQVFSYILALSRKTLKADDFVRSGSWVHLEEASLPANLIGRDLHNKTLGIIGLGNIGRRVARIAHGFNMRILSYDPFVTRDNAKKIGVQLSTLDDVLSKADYVTIHTTLTSKTRRLIGSRELALMKPSAFIINTSRGAVINQKALVEALYMGQIAGAALDVFETEPIKMDEPLLQLDNVIVSPHYAGNSREALENTAMMVSTEASRIIKGELPLNLVNKQKLEKLGFLSNGSSP